MSKAPDNASGAAVQALKAALAKATPGPWLYRCKSNTFHKPPPEGTQYTYGESILALSGDEDETPQQAADMEFLLAAADPNTIGALFDALAQKDAELQRLREALKVAIDYIDPRVLHTFGEGERVVLPKLRAALNT
jgi:hypothetical protein